MGEETQILGFSAVPAPTGTWSQQGQENSTEEITGIPSEPGPVRIWDVRSGTPGLSPQRGHPAGKNPFFSFPSRCRNAWKLLLLVVVVSFPK